MSDRKISKAFVTGADGFIGSHLVERLLHEGIAVKALAQYNSFGWRGWLDDIKPELLSGIEIVLGDVRDQSFMSEAIKGCDTVFHLAALIGIPYSYRAVESYVEVNVTGTVNVLQAARANQVERVVHTSTSEVYGSAQFVPMTEEHPLNAQSPYAASKIGADQFALSYHKSFETPVVVVRPFNNFGPRQSTRAIIPTIISQFLSKQEFVRVGALTPTRDFVFVRDTARAFLRAALASEVVGQVVNVGSNFEISVSEIIKSVSKLTGRELRIETEEQRVRPAGSEVTRLWADNSKALKLLNWAPEYGGLEGFQRGLAESMAWYRERDNESASLQYGV